MQHATASIPNEREPLLNSTSGYGSLSAPNSDNGDGETYDNVPRTKRQLGLVSCIFLIFNRIIGTGIYATPSIILHASSGSVGTLFIMWFVGAFIAATGTAVYVEMGTAMPRSGGEKNYLEFIYRKPQWMITCVVVVYAIITGTAAANSVVFGEYLIHALGIPATHLNTRLLAWSCLTFCLLIHGVFLRTGILLQNTLGMFKLVILSAIAFCGIMSVCGVGAFQVKEGYEKSHAFDSWDRFWERSEGTKGMGANKFVVGLYNVIWSFVGYSNANYALSEIRNPIRTIKLAAPIALGCVTTMYLLVNVAYFGVVGKRDVLEGKRIVAALFFRNLFGPTTEKALSLFISLSTLGNLLSGKFAQGRVIQELGREGILPFSSFFSSNKPFNAPLAGLFTQYVFSCLVLCAVPVGDAYLFMISTSSYCSAIINTLVSFGLLLLYTPSYRKALQVEWNPPFRAPKVVIVLFFLSNVFLVVVPFIPPGEGERTYEKLPYWSHALVSWSVSLLGITYWYIKCKYLPRKNRYKLEREWVLQDDGVSRCVFRKVPLERERVD